MADENPFAQFAAPAENPFARFVETAPAAAPASPSVAEDVAKSGGIGVARGLIGMAAANPLMPGGGELTGALRSGLGYVADQTGGRLLNWVRNGTWAPTTGARESAAAANGAIPATTPNLTRAAESLTGPFYRPQTTPGHYAETIGDLGTSIVGGPGRLIPKLLTGLVAGGASEAAGQATRGTWAEPYARTAGAVFGGVGTMGAIRAGENAAARGAINRAAPTREQLRANADSAYRQADEAGVQFSQPAAARLASEVEQVFADFGAHPKLQPRADVAFQELNKLANTAPTLRELESARRIANQAGNTIDRGERSLAGRTVDKIDDLITNPRPGEVIAGEGPAAAQAMTDARANWGAMRRAEIVDEAVKRAESRAASSGSGANIDNALRQQVRRIVETPRLARGFSPEEIDAMWQVVNGTTGQNIARLAGKFAPTGVVSGGAGAALGYQVGGTAGAVAVPAAGRAAKFIADRSTRGAIEDVSALVRSRTLPEAVREALPVRNTAAQRQRALALRALLLGHDLRSPAAPAVEPSR